MRKDLRVGTAIGGVLVAVLVVYAVVVPPTKKNDKSKSAVVLQTGGTGASSTGGASDLGAGEPAGASHDTNGSGPAAGSGQTSGADAGATGNTGGATGAGTNVGGGTTAAGGTNVGSGAATGDTGTGASGNVAPGAGAPPAPGAGSGGTDWRTLLSADHVDDSTLRTSTPPPARRDGAAVLAGDNRPGVDAPGGGSAAGATGSPANNGATGSSHSGGSISPGPGVLIDPPPPSNASVHKVQAGETFSSIAKSVYGDARYYKEIAKANPNVNPSRLRPGTSLRLPDKSSFKSSGSNTSGGASATASTHKPASAGNVPAIDSKSEYRVQSTDSLYKISMKLYHTPNRVDEIYQLNKDRIGADPAKLKLNMVLKLPEPPTQTASR